jgi:hypothetical protein
MAKFGDFRAGIKAFGQALFTGALVAAASTAAAGNQATAGVAGTTRPTETGEPSWIEEMVANREMAKEIAHQNGVNWCQTDERFALNNPELNILACATYGSGDTPSVRDANIPTASTPVKTIRLYFNVFANNDGTSPAATASSIQAQVNQLNSDFAPSKIQFTDDRAGRTHP